MSSTLSLDFREEYEAERTLWLRRRFLWFSGVMAVFSVFQLVASLLGFVVSEDGTWTTGNLLVVAGTGIPQSGLYVVVYLFVLRRSLSRDTLMRLAVGLTVVVGAIAVVSSPFMAKISGQRVNPESMNPDVIRRWATLWTLFVTHLIPSLFIPWTVREATRPLVPLVLIYSVTMMLLGGGISASIGWIALSPLVGVPGLVICWWRHSRFRQRFHYRMLRSRYGDMQRELVDARRVHESLFPDPLADGPVRFHYCYEPMRQIGGDYLYISHDPGASARLNVVLLDVTGHGVAAALTVNRLYGELERLFAERPDMPPGEVVESLNRYVNLTLAKHGVYVTALCLRVDPAVDEIAWANAGHPPAFLRTAAGAIERLESTAALLGVFAGRDFDAGEMHVRFGPGDTLIAYTDGATDSCDEHGARFRIEGIQKTLANATPERDDHGRWAGALLRAIDQYRFGSAVDDTLLVEIWRPINDAPVSADRLSDQKKNPRRRSRVP